MIEETLAQCRQASILNRLDRDNNIGTRVGRDEDTFVLLDAHHVPHEHVGGTHQFGSDCGVGYGSCPRVWEEGSSGPGEQPTDDGIP